MLILFTILAGSLPSDFQKPTEQSHPFEPCPGTPNCVIHSAEYDIPHSDLYDLVVAAIKKMDPHQHSSDIDSGRIDAVFRIPLFGFKDDVKIAVQKTDNAKSVVHVKSASRMGYGDLGVNSRRIKRFFNHLNETN